MKLFILIFCSIVLAGCATAPKTHAPLAACPVANTYHTVKTGETLSSISRKYGIDIQNLSKANSIRDTDNIKRGEVLLIPRTKISVSRPDVSTPMTTNERFAWPVKGPVITPFGTVVDRVKNKGIVIRATEGIGIVASRSGRVVFCGEKVKGFGKTIILDHGNGLQTVYAYNSDILVRVGDVVMRNDPIARAGKTGRAKEPSLHFEIRKDGEPQNPVNYLPNS